MSGIKKEDLLKMFNPSFPASDVRTCTEVTRIYEKKTERVFVRKQYKDHWQSFNRREFFMFFRAGDPYNIQDKPCGGYKPEDYITRLVDFTYKDPRQSHTGNTEKNQNPTSDILMKWHGFDLEDWHKLCVPNCPPGQNIFFYNAGFLLQILKSSLTGLFILYNQSTPINPTGYLIHGDVKRDNICLDVNFNKLEQTDSHWTGILEPSKLKIIDLGLCFEHGETNLNHLPCLEVAPYGRCRAMWTAFKELCRGNISNIGKLDWRVDVYGLWCVINGFCTEAYESVFNLQGTRIQRKCLQDVLDEMATQSNILGGEVTKEEYRQGTFHDYDFENDYESAGEPPYLEWIGRVENALKESPAEKEWRFFAPLADPATHPPSERRAPFIVVPPGYDFSQMHAEEAALAEVVRKREAEETAFQRLTQEKEDLEAALREIELQKKAAQEALLDATKAKQAEKDELQELEDKKKRVDTELWEIEAQKKTAEATLHKTKGMIKEEEKVLQKTNELKKVVEADLKKLSQEKKNAETAIPKIKKWTMATLLILVCCLAGGFYWLMEGNGWARDRFLAFWLKEKADEVSAAESAVREAEETKHIMEDAARSAKEKSEAEVAALNGLVAQKDSAQVALKKAVNQKNQAESAFFETVKKREAEEVSLRAIGEKIKIQDAALQKVVGEKGSAEKTVQEARAALEKTKAKEAALKKAIEKTKAEEKELQTQVSQLARQRDDIVKQIETKKAELQAVIDQINTQPESGTAPTSVPVVQSKAPSSSPTSLSRTYTNSIGIEFVLIPAGSFMMGSPTSEKNRDDDDEYQHNVTISHPFYLGKYEVTQAQWETIMGKNSNRSKLKRQSNPVDNVSWNDAKEFIGRLNQKEGHSRYRLPTEAEWEYAARAGSTSTYSFGDDADQLGRYAWYTWYGGNSRLTTHPVGQRRPNNWGLHDMHGNVWEWCEDWYGENYYNNSSSTDPKGPPLGEFRVRRGGSWFSSARFCRSAYRDYYSPGGRSHGIGFRLVFSPEQ